MNAQCPTGKVTFASAHAAKHSRGARRNLGQRMRSYKCDVCHGWHLTTQGGRR